MKIALISDVHLEYNTELDIELPEADVLVCAGDIGSPFTQAYTHFLKEMRAMYDTVIVIPGNHEYYQQSPAQSRTHPRSMRLTERRIQEVCKQTNVIFLQKEFVDIDNVRFYGCTLWADPFSSGGEGFWHGQNDSKHISDLERPEDYLKMHNNHRQWLDTALRKAPKDKKIVVVTHHLPSYTLIDPKFKHSKKNGYYASHCDDLLPHADLWLAGHTHRFMDYSLDGTTRFCCNPVGYPWESLQYHGELCITI